MSILFLILVATFLISLISFIGILIFFFKEEVLERIILILVAFAAGSLLGGAFLHLIPESIESLGSGEDPIFKIFVSLLLGFGLFFILEQVIRWHHHHSTKHPEIMPLSYLILLSHGIHNFIDGLIIAASFLVSLPTGIITTLVIALHEIPQEIGDYGILIYGGVKKLKALFLNFFAASFSVLGGIAGFFVFQKIEFNLSYFLPFTAGTFIYIAASDLIPEIKNTPNLKKSLTYFFFLVLGIILITLIKIN